MRGLRCYPSLSAIPGPVDHVISSIPATGVLPLMDDAAAKGVHSIHFFTAGFRETGEQDRIELERQVLAKAKAAGIRLIGPNCMGLYCPSSGVSFGGDFPKEPGGVAFISQSGLNGEDLVHSATLRGLRFSKVISYGNATDLDESDFFEYCTVDPETEIILSYIEGVKDGRRFQRALRAASAAKPVVVLKGGLHGRRRSGDPFSHGQPGRLAADMARRSAARRASCRVETLEDLVDMAVTFRFLKPIDGPRRRHHRRRRRIERARGGHGREAGPEDTTAIGGDTGATAAFHAACRHEHSQPSRHGRARRPGRSSQDGQDRRRVAGH